MAVSQPAPGPDRPGDLGQQPGDRGAAGRFLRGVAPAARFLRYAAGPQWRRCPGPSSRTARTAGRPGRSRAPAPSSHQAHGGGVGSPGRGRRRSRRAGGGEGCSPRREGRCRPTAENMARGRPGGHQQQGTAGAGPAQAARSTRGGRPGGRARTSRAAESRSAGPACGATRAGERACVSGGLRVDVVLAAFGDRQKDRQSAPRGGPLRRASGERPVGQVDVVHGEQQRAIVGARTGSAGAGRPARFDAGSGPA